MQLNLQKLKVLGNVLYVAAHPDDENTRLITYLANEKKVNAAYFSFTRGDGGQNLIGPEIREELGVIRTQELLEARKIDNGEQFFSRAVDFGYSKHPDETFNIWDKEKVLGDLVWVIRKFRPDIIITRFNTIPGTTHGHHTASAILAEEAFEIAGDDTKYTEQLMYVKTWQPKTLYWNTYWWRRSEYQKDTADLISYDIGKYNRLLGLSYSEIAALSRSSHRSQGFGATGTRGIQKEYLQYVKGQNAEKDAFEVTDLSWNKIEGGKVIDVDIDHILSAFDPANPEGILNDIINLRKNIGDIQDDFWKQRKLEEIDEIIYAITGLFLEIKANDYTASPGDEVNLTIEAINRSSANIVLEKIMYKTLGVGSKYLTELKNNDLQNLQSKITIPNSTDFSQPYWLINDHGIGMFEVNDQRLIGKGENDPAVTADFLLKVNGEEIVISKPIIYKRNDPVRGEVYRPFVIAPPVYANISGSVVIFANHTSQEIKVDVKAGKGNLKGAVKLNLPGTWKIEPSFYEFELSQKGEIATFLFNVTPPDRQETATASAIVQLNETEYNYSFTEISYDHIPAQLLFNSTDVKFVKLDLEKGNEKIGYIIGAGDNIPDNLRQLGYEVDIINELEFNAHILDQYDVIILGIRALNTVDRLKFDMDKLLEFVHRGGNLIIQYNTSHRLVTENFAPYPMKLSRDRVAVEEAEVKILNENHAVMNFPNKISQNDFEDWVQERGLYFPGSWSDEFEPILSSHDPGEDPLEGGLLVAKYGKGYYIYSGYSWFRELPAGVPGAYRIFVNMISIAENIQQSK
ncbi:MAG: PIG-L family deacetylase [Cyclobacteriaceae bacterium]|nr:PIG-L family deacetylase [Cyclobacteriaceae bacterium]